MDRAGIYFDPSAQMAGPLGSIANLESQKTVLERQVRDGALRLAHNTEEAPEAVVARAAAYIAFING